MNYFIGKEFGPLNPKGGDNHYVVTLLVTREGRIFETSRKEEALERLKEALKTDPQGRWFLLGISYPEVSISVSFKDNE
jgi:hypothetical protein